MEVILQKGNEGNIQVTADDNLQEYVIVESNGKILKVYLKENTSISSKKGLSIIIPFTEISEVSLVGSGDIMSKDSIKADAFTTELTGSGDIKLTLEGTTVDAKVNGSGAMKLEGNAKEFELKVIGSGGFDGSTLATENTEVYISGSGDAKVNAKKYLKARVNGSGNVQYAVPPHKSDTKVLGSGSINSM